MNFITIIWIWTRNFRASVFLPCLLAAGLLLECQVVFARRKFMQSVAAADCGLPKFVQRRYEVEVEETLRWKQNVSDGKPVLQVHAVSGCTDESVVYRLLSSPQEQFRIGRHTGYVYSKPTAGGGQLKPGARFTVAVSSSDRPGLVGDQATVIFTQSKRTKRSGRGMWVEAAGAWKHRKRVKRGWTYPPISVMENSTLQNGQPKFLAQVHSDNAFEIEYRLEGPGASQPGPLGQPPGLFQIDRNDGRVHLHGILDREKISLWNFTVYAVKASTQEYAEEPLELHLTVLDKNDNPPVFPGNQYYLIKERMPVGTQIGDHPLVATDADDPLEGGNAQVKYSVEKNEFYGGRELFNIDWDTGKLRTNAVFDREDQSLYSIRIRGQDMFGNAGGFAGFVDVTVEIQDINDNAPIFEKPLYQVSVPENWVAGSTVIEVRATDADVAFNAECTYGIPNVVPPPPPRKFEMETVPDGTKERMGIVKLYERLDYETMIHAHLKPEYNVTLQARNEHPAADTWPQIDPVGVATLIVTVIDVNEPPEFTQKVYDAPAISEDAQPRTSVIQVTAIDQDTHSGWNDISYKVDSRTDMLNWFDVGELNGQVITLSKLDREAPHIVDDNVFVTILAIDKPTDGTPAETGSATVKIQLIDVNDNFPRLTGDINGNVCTDAKKDQLVMRVNATDADKYEMGHGPPFTWQVDPFQRSMSDFFSIQSVSDTEAEIRTELSNYKEDEYMVPIEICDAGSPKMCSSRADNIIHIKTCKCTDGVCGQTAEPIILGLSTGALFAIIVSFFVLMVLVLIFIIYTRRTRKQPEMEQPFYDDDIRETFISYDDEGGGEEDQDSYDITQLRKPADSSPPGSLDDKQWAPYRNVPIDYEKPRRTANHPLIGENPDVGQFINDRLNDADDDDYGPPDYTIPFQYEGGGSLASSLSSLASGTSDGDQSYDYLKDWGPRFKKLADMYGGGDDTD